MKIFWSWQSDTPGNIGRFFVRDVLQEASHQLNADLTLDEAQREFSLDHDRKGVPGSPALAELIYEKIRASDVFVADVTLVGATTSQPPKKLVNSNVAIELGYGLGAHSDRRLLMIMNTAFGTRDELPFDLRHKAGPISYHLEATASKHDISSAAKPLVSELKIALRAMLETHVPNSPVYKPTPAIDGDPSRYFTPTELLVETESSFRTPAPKRLTGPNAAALVFLRVLPTRPQTELSYPEAQDLLQGSQLRPFGGDLTGMEVTPNAFGAIAYFALPDEGQVLSATQLFRNRELWGFDSYLPAPINRPKHDAPSGIWARELEDAFTAALPLYVDFLASHAKVPPPYDIIAGASNIKQHRLYVFKGQQTLLWGPFLTNTVTVSHRLENAAKPDFDAARLAISEKFFEATGHRRPSLFNGFPPKPSQIGQ